MRKYGIILALCALSGCAALDVLSAGQAGGTSGQSVVGGAAAVVHAVAGGQQGVSRITVNLGAGEIVAGSISTGYVFAGSRITTTSPDLGSYSSGIFTVQFTADRRMEKNWSGFGGGFDGYLIILVRNVL